MQIAVNISAAKTVDRLLGITNQQQSAFFGVISRAVNLVKQAVLQRRGILKFINQRDGVLGQNAGAQGRAVVPGQRHIQALQHVGKTKGSGLAFKPLQPLLHLSRSVQTQLAGKAGQSGQRLQNIRQLLRLGR